MISAASLTFRLWFQTGMRARRWIWKPVAADDLRVVPGGGLGEPRQVGVREVDVVEAKLLIKAHGPLEVVHQRPGRVASQVDAIQHNSCSGAHTAGAEQAGGTELPRSPTDRAPHKNAAGCNEAIANPASGGSPPPCPHVWHVPL